MSTSPVFNLAFAAAIGVAMVVLATRIRAPSIALLLLTGIAVGPEGLGLIEPEVLGSGLQLVVGFAVAIILFEGGLTLDIQGARRSPGVIRRMLTVGVVITWLGTALVAWGILGLSPGMALVCGSLVIVTGPTVISPLLRRIGVRERLKHILYWEAVLIDAIGVFIAVLCLEWVSPENLHTTWTPVMRFAARVAVGTSIGAAAGALMAFCLRRRLVADEQVNIFVLAVALLAYAICETLLHESGILAVIIAGLIVALTKPEHLDELKRFKLELTEFGIGMLFVLLAARLDLDAFLAQGWPLVAAIAILLLVLRPLGILISTAGYHFSIQEKAFLSWIAPRGIVAAFMASLFALELAQEPTMAAQAAVLETFTFAVIGVTVMLQGFSAPWLARLLGLGADRQRTWLIVGDNAVPAALAGALREAGARAMALAAGDYDSSSSADNADLLHGDPRDRELLDNPKCVAVNRVLSISPSREFNQLVCRRWAELVGPDRCWAGDAKDLWPEAPSPMALAQGLESGTLAISPIPISADDDVERFGTHLTPLFHVVDGNAVFCDTERASAATTGTVVAVRQRIPGLGDLIADAIVIEDEHPDFDLVVERLLTQAAQIRSDLAVDNLKQSILERERSMPTAMGSGIAIPHAYADKIAHSQCYVANVRRGLATVSNDAASVRLVFLVLSPVGNAEEHLQSLASVARLSRDLHYVGILERQQTREALLARIRERA